MNVVEAIEVIINLMKTGDDVVVGSGCECCGSRISFMGSRKF